jgi:glycosyltransferase involved in cell wall biosynthesis
VASAVGGLPEFVQHEKTGLLVPPGDESALRAALVRLARERDLVREMSRNCFAAARHFALEPFVERYLAAYSQCPSGASR